MLEFMKFVLGLPIDAARKAWPALRWLVLSPEMYKQDNLPVRLLLVRTLVAWGAAACVLPSLLPLPLALIFTVAAGPLAAVVATLFQAFAQSIWSEWSGRY